MGKSRSSFYKSTAFGFSKPTYELQALAGFDGGNFRKIIVGSLNRSILGLAFVILVKGYDEFKLPLCVNGSVFGKYGCSCYAGTALRFREPTDEVVIFADVVCGKGTNLAVVCFNHRIFGLALVVLVNRYNDFQFPLRVNSYIFLKYGSKRNLLSAFRRRKPADEIVIFADVLRGKRFKLAVVQFQGRVIGLAFVILVDRYHDFLLPLRVNRGIYFKYGSKRNLLSALCRRKPADEVVVRTGVRHGERAQLTVV